MLPRRRFVPHVGVRAPRVLFGGAALEQVVVRAAAQERGVDVVGGERARDVREGGGAGELRDGPPPPVAGI